MVDLKATDETLTRYIRPQTFPLAVRLCEPGEDLPDRARLPKRDLGISVTACQGLAMARRYGWTIAIGKEDQVCPHGHAVLGFVPPGGYLDGSLAEEAGLGSREKFAKTAESLSLLEYGKYRYLLVAPIQSAAFDPHFIMVFGNPAQVARLVQGATALSGGSLTFAASGGIGCSVFVARTLRTDQCQVVLAGAGDRYFALTQDHEMAFTIPMSKVETTMKGLEHGHREMGHRYPTPSWLRFEGQLPDKYYKLTELLLQQK